jgi:hypothetical protein
MVLKTGSIGLRPDEYEGSYLQDLMKRMSRVDASEVPR